MGYIMDFKNLKTIVAEDAQQNILTKSPPFLTL